MKQLATILTIATLLCTALPNVGWTAPSIAEKCPNMQHSIKIIDNSSGTIQTFEELASSASYPEFIQYVRDVSAHVLQTIRTMPDCATAESVNVDMVFVYTPVMASRGVAKIIPSKKGRESLDIASEKSLDSPWASLTFSKNAKRLNFYGAFHWNQRQFLADQVSLDGITDFSHAVPITPSEFSGYTSAYQKWFDQYLFMLSEKNLPIQKMSKQDFFAAWEKKMPPDILWLLYTSPQGHRPPFEMQVMNAMGTLQRKIVDSYTNFTHALTTAFFHQKETASNFINFKDIAVILDPKIYPPHITTLKFSPSKNLPSDPLPPLVPQD
jgi:hypothetical protein